LLLACADVLQKHADELAGLLSLENGKPVADARQNDVEFLIGVFRFFGNIIDKLPAGDFFDAGSIYSLTVLEPFGLSGPLSLSTGHQYTPVARSHQLSRWVTQSFSSQVKLTL
jgi:acyl-CoA reductase-like NAD-dependent aldehyde dehydrogenase